MSKDNAFPFEKGEDRENGIMPNIINVNRKKPLKEAVLDTLEEKFNSYLNIDDNSSFSSSESAEEKHRTASAAYQAEEAKQG